MTRRRLTDEEIQLWHKVVDQTERLHGDRHGAPLPKPKPTKVITPRLPDVKPRPALKPSFSEPVQMDRKAFTRMKRGKLVPDGKLDLHGMTQDRAHPALRHFILSAQASGQRLVLVITGKGRSTGRSEPFLAEKGVLKRQVPMWLSMPPLAQAVMQVRPAHISHGGDGALYVYLRKAR